MYQHALKTVITGCLSFFMMLTAGSMPAVDTIPRLQRPDNAVHFLVMGDWGVRGNKGQRQVATAMAVAAEQLDISFIITTGDNFYPSGVESVSDSHWVQSFRNVYDAASLQCAWLPVLGNHDYGLDPEAQVEYSQVDKRWRMPARYYDTSIAIGRDSLLMIFLDTEPMERQLRGLSPDTARYSVTYVDEQIAWLKELLRGSRAKWKIVTGHHPLHTGGSRRHNVRVKKLRKLLQPIFHANGVNFYFAGHEHHLELLQPKGPTSYVISGGGFDARHVGWLKFHRLFARRSRGFVTVSISADECLLQFVNDHQQVIYSRRFR